jgi:hypothetical protein
VAIIGFLSDSHGEWLRTRNAIQLLEEKGCSEIIHLGDVETHEVLDELAGHQVSLVFGNCDYVSRLHEYAVRIGLDVQHPAGTLQVDDLSIGFLHGHDIDQYRNFLKDDGIGIVAHGHSHEIRDEIVENTRCINPGALHRAPMYTVCVLDTKSMKIEFLEVDA